MTEPSTTTTAKRYLPNWLAVPKGAVLQGILTAGSCVVLVKAMGFGKDLVVASRYGTADALDAFAMAYIIPALTATIFGGVHDALVPAHAEYYENDRREDAGRLMANGLTFFATCLAMVLLTLGFFHHGIVEIIANGFPEEKQALTRELFLQLLPFAWCLGVSYYLSAWLNSHKQFLVAAIAPAVIPVCSILALQWIPGDGIHVLVHATQAGGILLVLAVVWALRRQTGVKVLGWNWRSPEMRRLVWESLPLLAGPLVTAGLPVVDMYMAGHHESGDVSVLGYSEKICSIFFAVLATSVGTALFPFLADLSAQGKWHGLQQKLHQYLLLTALVAIPLVGLVWWLAPWIVSLLFERGAFQASDAERVAAVLRCHAIQIPFYVAAVLNSHVVMAMRSGRFMLLTTLVNLSLNVVMNNLLIGPFGLAGIPLATAFVYLLSAAMLYGYIRRQVTVRSVEPSPVLP
jgi:putative peptidoglycan lipid II flippase